MKLYDTDKRVFDIVRSIQDGVEVPKHIFVDGRLFYKTQEDDEPRLVIPDDEDLKNRVIYENHDVLSAGHPGYYKTYLAVQKKYYWPRMDQIHPALRQHV